MTSRYFDGSLGCLVSPALDELATQLSFIGRLGPKERDVITDATRESLYTVLHNKLSPGARWFMKSIGYFSRTTSDSCTV